jgi:hypothetical protein
MQYQQSDAAPKAAAASNTRAKINEPRVEGHQTNVLLVLGQQNAERE